MDEGEFPARSGLSLAGDSVTNAILASRRSTSRRLQWTKPMYSVRQATFNRRNGANGRGSRLSGRTAGGRGSATLAAAILRKRTRLPAVAHDRRPGNIASVRGSAARDEQRRTRQSKANTPNPRVPPAKGLSRDAQEDDRRRNLDRLAGTSERDSVGALEVLRGEADGGQSCFACRGTWRRTSRENVAGTSGVRIGPEHHVQRQQAKIAREGARTNREQRR